MRRSFTLLLAAVFVTACDPQPTTGALVVNVSGLPNGALGAVRISGPNQFYRAVLTTTTVEDLPPGRYAVIRDTVTVAGNRYGVALVRDSVTIERGRSASTTAAYTLSSGTIALDVSGLPENIVSSVRVRGPLPQSSYNQVHTATTNIAGLLPGQYDIVAEPLTTFLGDQYSGAPLTQNVTVAASMTPVPASVAYQLSSGSLAITVNGLPPSSSFEGITVTGPNSFLRRTAQSITLRGLAPGTYNVAATNVTGSCPNVYAATTANQSVNVAVGATTDATVTYANSSTSPADLNLKVEKLYLMQATQNYQGTVPIVAGKPALLRVFGVANQCNTVKPKVRVTTSTGFVQTIDAPEDSVRLTQDETRELTSWNVVVPAANVQAGMTVVAEMDVTGLVAETDKADNRFPAVDGKSIDVRTVPPMGLRFVPIVQSGLTGDPAALIGMEWPRKIHPVSSYDVDVRSSPLTSSGTLQACTSSATGLTVDNNNNTRCLSWENMLGEVNALRISDGANRYYYGVAKVNYNSGVAGIAYVPGKAGMGWDYAQSGSRVMAHEMGHNFARFHAPCGNPGGPDASYPYAGGVVGVHGWDPTEGFKVASGLTDVMGYCGNQWISDYTYVGMLDWITSPNRGPTLPSVAGAEQPSLLVWGRISGGDIVLEPAFEVNVRPAAIAPGPHRIAALDENGVELFATSFAGERIADLPGEPETFAFHVPLSALRGRTLASLKLTANGRTATNVASADVAADPNAVLTRVNARFARIRWDAARFPVVMVRDPDTGQVLSFARGGDMTVATSKNALDLNFSNRVRSSRRYREFK
jgi:hypothetical protein